MLQFNTQQGIFGPGGHGGGIFQTTVQGLGAINYCWNDFGFKGCHTEAGAIAHRFCQNEMKIAPGSSDWKGCYTPVFAEQVENCSRKYCSSYDPTSPATMATLPKGVYSDLTKRVQTEANVALASLGYLPISTDGKLGGKTCGAIKVAISSGKVKGWVMPKSCSGITVMPVKGGGALPRTPTSPTSSSTRRASTLPASSSATTAQPYSPGMSTGKKLVIAGVGVLLAVGAFTAWKKR